MVSDSDLREALRRYWGYESFRPRQEQIVRSLLENRDTCVVMPTGGGKSLCYQLPAALMPEKTAIVISPLIALMQDQVAQLTHMGIPAAVLNSSVSAAEQTQITRAACAGKYRLLYVSPERLARADTASWVQRVPLSFFVIDEAHCISEWGHEFRPEYRQLSRLRTEFPDRPIAAFTASATHRVRHDIIDQLQLKNPDKYIASFHRPNLRYIVRECKSADQMELLLKAVRRHSDGHVIVYSPTIARVGQTVAFLESNGIPAVEYHGKMNPAARRSSQERWMSDEVRVLVGTIAFGLGINKACVRAVIHLSLPKAIEQYYQEAGRAGRDGQPADCLLLWQRQDVVLLAHFIREITDPEERERARGRNHDMQRFVDSTTCRHRQICVHFGETPKWRSCGACDVCGCGAEWALEPAKPPRRVRRDRPGRPDGKNRKDRSNQAPHSQQLPAENADSGLREYLRQWRRQAAKQHEVPAFVVMHDTSLDELCQRKPRTLSELREVPGFGKRKTELYGNEILAALKSYAQASQDHPR
jgi:ATP-dependent DNA helicase RecQ